MIKGINPLAAYGKVANAQTDPLQQIIMLYDGAIKFLCQAAADIEAGDLTAKAEHTNRALDILSYLQSILDFEKGGEVAPTLDALYTSLMRQILSASATLDGEKMKHAAESLSPVREAWAAGAPATNANVALAVSMPMMGSYQTIA